MNTCPASYLDLELICGLFGVQGADKQHDKEESYVVPMVILAAGQRPWRLTISTKIPSEKPILAPKPFDS
jgi:hypothetical protein